MKIADHLTREQKQQLEKMKSPRKKENLSKRDLDELMGVNMQTLHRKRGGALGN